MSRLSSGRGDIADGVQQLSEAELAGEQGHKAAAVKRVISHTAFIALVTATTKPHKDFGRVLELASASAVRTPYAALKKVKAFCAGEAVSQPLNWSDPSASITSVSASPFCVVWTL